MPARGVTAALSPQCLGHWDEGLRSGSKARGSASTWGKCPAKSTPGDSACSGRSTRHTSGEARIAGSSPAGSGPRRAGQPEGSAPVGFSGPPTVPTRELGTASSSLWLATPLDLRGGFFARLS